MSIKKSRELRRSSGKRLVLLPKPQKKWLLAGTALFTGAVVAGFGGSIVTATPAAAQSCTFATVNPPVGAPYEIQCSLTIDDPDGAVYDAGIAPLNQIAKTFDGDVRLTTDVGNLPTFIDQESGAGIDIDGTDSDSEQNGYDIEINVNDWTAIRATSAPGVRAFADDVDNVGTDNGDITVYQRGFIEALNDDGVQTRVDDGESRVSNYGIIGVDFLDNLRIAFDGDDYFFEDSGTLQQVFLQPGSAFTIDRVGGNGITSLARRTGDIWANNYGQIFAVEDGINTRATLGGTTWVYNGALEDSGGGLIDALEDGVHSTADRAGSIYVQNGRMNEFFFGGFTDSKIFADGEYGIFALSEDTIVADPQRGEGVVEALNFGLVETTGENAIAGIHVESNSGKNVSGYAAALNGGELLMKGYPINPDARVNAYDLDGGKAIPRYADGLQTYDRGGVFFQEDDDIDHGKPYTTAQLLGGYGGHLTDWFGDNPILGFHHNFSTVARNYGTWDFTGWDHWETPGYDDGKSVPPPYRARTIGGVYAPFADGRPGLEEDAGGNAWENINHSNLNSGLWNFGTMIGNGRPTCYSKDDECIKVPQAAGAPVLRSVTVHYDRNSDSHFELGPGIPNFLYIYNAGYQEHSNFFPGYVVRDEEPYIGDGPYLSLEDQFATYGVIGSRNTPAHWQFDPKFAFNTNFGFQTENGVDWGFIQNTLLEDGLGPNQLYRFGEAAGDRLLEAYGPENGGAGILMINDGLLIGTVKEEIDERADLFSLEDKLGLPTGISSIHLNTGSWFTRGFNGFFGHEDIYANVGLVQSAFKPYGPDGAEWTVFKDLETTVNVGVYSLLDGGIEDRMKFDGDYYGGLGPVGYLLPEYGGGEYDGGGGPGFDLSFLEKGNFALDAFLAGFEDPRAGADLFHIGGYLGGKTGLIVHDVNPGVSQDINPIGIPVVAYHEVGVLTNGDDCSYYPYAICGDDDSVHIDPQTLNYAKEGNIPVIVDGFIEWTLRHYEDGLRIPNGGPGWDKGWEDIGGHYRLVSDYGGNSARLPGVTLGAQLLWYELLRITEHARNQEPSGGGGADLSTDFSVADYGAPASPGPSNGLWAKAGGSWIETDTTLTQGMMSYDTSFDQDIYSILGGADMKPGGADSPYQIGVFGGYVTSDVDFNAGAPGTSVDYEGGSLGAYLNYVNGAFFADALVKGEYLDTTYSLGGGFGDVNTDLWNIGVMANTGYRMTMGSAFLEPLASFAYVHTNVDDGSNNGTSVDFSNGTSLRAGAGARVGTVMATGNATTEFSLLGQIWNEFEGDNEVTVSGIGTSETFTDDTSGVFGEAEATITVTNSDGTLSGFLSGGGKWGEHWNAWNAQVGIRKGF